MGMLGHSSAGGTPVRPGTPYILAQSAIAASVSNTTSEETLATITLPAGALGLNGHLKIWTTWTVTNGINDKILRVRFSGAAGTQYLVSTQTAIAHAQYLTIISNRGAANSQVGAVSALSTGTSSGAVVTSAVDTAAASTIVISGQKEVGTEVLTLERYLVEIWPS